MKHLLAMTIMLAASCVIPTNEGGDNAPDVGQATPPDAATVEKAGASWYDVRDECRRYCNVLDGMCVNTSGSQWYTDCLALCVDIADEAYAADCLDTAEAWMRCEWADQPWQCNGPWAWASPDACVEERGAYEVCR